MVKMKSEYKGQLHCEVVHGPSQTLIETDAPVDNQGRGEKFSPTDLMGAALISCVLTTMAIVAERHKFPFLGATAETTKEMTKESPRRIASLKTVVKLSAQFSENERQLLENAAHKCPVHMSLHPSIDAAIEFVYI